MPYIDQDQTDEDREEAMADFYCWMSNQEGNYLDEGANQSWRY